MRSPDPEMAVQKPLGTRRQTPKEEVCTVGVIGTGHYGTAFLCQTQAIPKIHVSIVCDRDLTNARKACRLAGIPEEKVVPCQDRKEILQLLRSPCTLIVEDSRLLLSAPLDVVVECTGDAETGAYHASLALQQGKHVAMVTKETDVVVGPLLQQQATRARLAYTPVDGDQHGLLIHLVSWCRALGLEIVAAGKARDSEFILRGERLVRGGETIHLSPDQVPFFQPLRPGATLSFLKLRNQILSGLARVEPFDICELTVAANATGLSPDIPELHAPVLRTIEIPEALGCQDEGGILSDSGRIEAVSCLRNDHEAGLGGGVFCVVRSHNAYSRRILSSKGCITDSKQERALVYRPYHLCGVETATTVLSAKRLGEQANMGSDHPKFDMICEAMVPWKKGERLSETRDGRLGVRALIVPYTPLSDSSPPPYFLAMGCVLNRDMSPGEIIDSSGIVPPKESTLWSLRKEQDILHGAGRCP